MPGDEFEVGLAVVDASVAVRWIVPEEGAAEAIDLLARPIDWIAPRLLMTEVTSALARKARSGELSVDVAMDGLDFLARTTSSGALRLERDELVIRAALTLALQLQHKLADCVYLALAEETGAGLATADQRLGDLARLRFVPCFVVSSA